MLERRPVFPGVIEMNLQAGWRIGCNVYLVYDDRDWVLVDIGYEESVDEIIELIRQLDFPLSQCRALVATHADVDHIQGLAKARSILKAPVLAHPKAVESLQTGDRIKTFAEIAAQNVHLPMPTVKVDRTVDDTAATFPPSSPRWSGSPPATWPGCCPATVRSSAAIHSCWRRRSAASRAT